jgi:cytochrome c553
LAWIGVAGAFAAVPAPGPDLLTAFRAAGGPMEGVDEWVFALRKPNETDGHWYANIGYYAHDPERKAWREGGRLVRWQQSTGKQILLVDDPRGGVRDPQLHYSGKKILFSYRKGGTEAYHLYEIGIDGTGLRQLTDGPFDDFEPTYLPDDRIVFVSTRCKRWVNCWLTQVAVLHRCEADGSKVQALSSNNEQDNTPWPMPDGRLLYTRWEYVDRSQVDYHHLWAANPDGTAQTVWYGNLHPGVVMIDAKPVPGSDRVAAIFSPGHGRRDHAGHLVLVDPKAGPDAKSAAQQITKGAADFRDPWAFSDKCFVAALGATVVALDDQGRQQTMFRLTAAEAKDGWQVHEPRPLVGRPRERLLPERTKPAEVNGRLILADIYEGRNMAGVQRGEIKKLLVLETLPMPIHYTGGMEPISYGGTFTLERIVGTVPVEQDGSAFFELPALRSFFLVALDERDLAVKRMQSFLTVQPGEVTSCLGCHEQRTKTPSANYTMLATARPASRIEPIAGVPDVIDFPRDVQPILNALCVDCHGYEKTAAGGPRAGRLLLTGDRGPMYSQSYYMLTIARLFSDGRNQATSNYAPRKLGSAASRLLNLVDGSHYGAKATPAQHQMLRLWIDSGAAYPGTYAALGTGMIGGYAENQQVDTDATWPVAKAAGEAIARRCAACHSDKGRALPRSLADERGVSFWRPDMSDPRLLTSRHIVFNLTRPDKSLMLLAPLAESAGGWGICRDAKTKQPVTVFADTSDADYRKILALSAAGQEHLARVKRFDMPGFQPRRDWVREMVRYGVLPAGSDGEKVPLDAYAIEQRYWRSLWYSP